MHHRKNLSFLSRFGLRAVFSKGSSIAVFVSIVTPKRAWWPPLFINFFFFFYQLLVLLHQCTKFQLQSMLVFFLRILRNHLTKLSSESTFYIYLIHIDQNTRLISTSSFHYYYYYYCHGVILSSCFCGNSAILQLRDITLSPRYGQYQGWPTTVHFQKYVVNSTFHTRPLHFPR